MSTKPDDSQDRARQLFSAALSRPAGERAEFVAGACGGDAALRAELETLLRAHEAADGRLDDPGQVSERPGDRIGHYKLLQKIGEGGFGVVWMAEQEEPVRRKVALKVLKPGMDTAQVVGRFEAERQALALMDHPNIAKVFDGGATPTGRPYFVMELVKGVPITEFCDGAGLGMEQRLQLFVHVCQAVQHAHQKGVIHRDIKPSNVLVTLHDGQPVPKVIDFGIAKATAARLTDKTVFTEFRQMLGTPEYMAPEQAELSGLDVDTRADIYSLGVLLYELLTGTRPFELKTLLHVGYAEMLRTIKEVDPPKPSTRVSTLGEQITDIARHRQVSPKGLSSLMRGDLDWIVMKALEKERSRRYETATALSEDVLRHLRDEPVLASPPSRAYRIRKYVRRHRVGAAAGAAIALSLVAGAVASSLGYVEAKEQTKVSQAAERRADAEKADAVVARDEEARQREAAEQARTEANAARVEAEQQRQRALAGAQRARDEAAAKGEVVKLLSGMLSSSDPHEVKGPDYTVRQMLGDFDHQLDGLQNDPVVEIDLRLVAAKSYLGLGLPDKAEPHTTRALELAREHLGEQHPVWARCILVRAQALHARGDSRGALAAIDEATIELAQDPDAARIRNNIRAALTFDSAVAAELRGDLPLAERYLREYLELRDELPEDELPRTAAVVERLALVLFMQGQLTEAEPLAREALESWRSLRGANSSNAVESQATLGMILVAKGTADERAEARVLMEQAVVHWPADGHPDHLANLLTQLGQAQWDAGELEAAVATLQRGVEAWRSARGEKHPDVAVALEYLLELLEDQRAWTQVEDVARQILELRKAHRGAADSNRLEALESLARALTEQGKNDEAATVDRQVDELISALLAQGGMASAVELASSGNRLLLRGRIEEGAQRVERAYALLAAVPDGGRPEALVAFVQVLQAHALLLRDRPAEAEPLAREALEIRARLAPGSFGHYSAMASLGRALAGQGKLEEAEPLLLEACEKMHPPAKARDKLQCALQCLVKLYDARGQTEQAATWRAKLAKSTAGSPPVEGSKERPR